MNGARLRIEGDSLYLAGPVNLNTTPGLLKRLQDELPALLTRVNALRVDCAAIDAVDSSIAALLLELGRQAQARGLSLQIERPNSQVISLLTLYGVEWLLTPDFSPADPTGLPSAQPTHGRT